MKFFINDKRYPILVPRLGGRGAVHLGPGEAVEGEAFLQLATGRNPVLVGPLDSVEEGVRVVWSATEERSSQVAVVTPPNPPRFGLVIHHGPPPPSPSVELIPTPVPAPPAVLSEPPKPEAAPAPAPDVQAQGEASGGQEEARPGAAPDVEVVERVGDDVPAASGWSRTKLRALRAEQVRAEAERIAAERGVELPSLTTKESLIDFLVPSEQEKAG